MFYLTQMLGRPVVDSDGNEIGAITIPIATSNVSEREMRGRLSDMMLDLVGRHSLTLR